MLSSRLIPRCPCGLLIGPARRSMSKTAKPKKKILFQKESINEKGFKVQRTGAVIREMDEGSELLYGFYPVQMALSAGKRKVHKIFHSSADSKKVTSLVDQAREMGIETQECSPAFLNGLCNRYSTKDQNKHNGVTAHVSKLECLVVSDPFDPIPDFKRYYCASSFN